MSILVKIFLLIAAFFFSIAVWVFYIPWLFVVVVGVVAVVVSV